MKVTLLSDNTNGRTVEVSCLEELASLIQCSSWCTGVFRDNYRNKANFISADFIALDFDSGLTLKEAKHQFSGFKHIIATTRNHQKEKNGVVCDRFRVVLKLSAPITDSETFTATYLELMKLYPTDPACKDASRMFYPSKEIVSGDEEGKEIIPSAKLPLNNRTKKFLTNGAPEGEWNKELVQSIMNMRQQKYTAEEILAYTSGITGHLDERDLKTIKYLLEKEPEYETQLATEDDTILTYLDKWIAHHKVTVTYDGITHMDGKEIAFDRLVNKLIIQAYSEGVTYPTKVFDAKLYEWYTSREERTLDKYRDLLRHRETTFNWKEFITLLAGDYNELDEVVLKHFIWQVKRKLFKKEVVWHMMPILVGKTGGGKSTIVKKMLAPLHEICLHTDMSVVHDSREYHALGRYYVMFMDELAKIDKVSVESLKKQITSERISYRKLGTNQHITLTNCATFIGTSNNDIIDSIHDPTSVRRYYQINCAYIKEEQYPQVSAFNYEAMWQSVDENKDTPLKGHLHEVNEIQKDLKATTSLEDWIELKTEPSEEAHLSPEEAYDSYIEFMDMQGNRNKLSMKKFLRDLSKLVDKIKTSGKIKYKLKYKETFKPGSNL